MNNREIELLERKDEQRLWWHVEPWLLLVLALLLTAAVANWACQ